MSGGVQADSLRSITATINEVTAMGRGEARVATYRYGEPRGKEGLRIGASRYPPRGVKKSDYAEKDQMDLWLRMVAPSADLIKWYRHENGSPSTFFRRYRKEMSSTEPEQVIALLGQMAQQRPIAIGCSCEDPERCHRLALAELIRASAD